MTALQIELQLLYHFADELQECIQDTTCPPSLTVLASYAKKTYQETSCVVGDMLENNAISHDLLWTLYKPGDILYTTCTKTNRPRAVRFVHGTVGRLQSFQLDCRYVDYNGTKLGEAALELSIPVFHGYRAIDSLKVFPLKYHINQPKIRQDLLLQGGQFLSLRGCHHRYYASFAVPVTEEHNVPRVAVKSKIMVDPNTYYQSHPYGVSLLSLPEENYESSNVGEDYVELETLSESSRLICCPLVLGYCLNDQQWCMRVII